MQRGAAPTFDPVVTSIRAVIPAPGSGHIAMAGFPGLRSDIEGTPYLDPDQMGETLVGLSRTGARALLVLTEEAELPQGAFALLRQVATANDLDLNFATIRDFGVPGPAFLEQWPRTEQHFLAALQRGETVAMCCQYGAGRSGLTAALLLIACAVPPDRAIRLVREHFSEAIENAAQENWLLSRLP